MELINIHKAGDLVRVRIDCAADGLRGINNVKTFMVEKHFYRTVVRINNDWWLADKSNFIKVDNIIFEDASGFI